MILVTKLVNLISASGLNKRKCLELLNELNSVYNGLLMYNNVRRLRRGKVLQRFGECLDEVKIFLINENLIEKYNELLDVERLSKLISLINLKFTDLCLHLNELNIKLQGVNKTIIMFDLIKAFQVKL